MSWGTCYKGSNNIHPGFPAMMSDGQWATNWEPACTINKALKKQVGITNNYQYRQYLIKNADNIIEKNQLGACDNCCACWENYKDRNAVKCPNKYIFQSCSDQTKPFGYQTSDLKNLYLSSKALESRLVAPIMSQSQMLNLPNYN
jgi:hypothetical protein